MKEKQIIKVFEDNNRVYGIEKLKRVLDQQGKYEISRQKIRQVIPQGCYVRDKGLYPVYMRRYRQKYWRKDLETRINILNGDFKASEPNKVWSADILFQAPCIWIEKTGWCYLSSKDFGKQYSKQIS